MNSPNTDHLPPHDIPAEQAIIGCVLLDAKSSLGTIVSRIGTDEVFYDLRNQTIWHCLTYLYSKNIPIDLISIQTELVSRKSFDQVGGFPYLNECEKIVPSAANLPTYLDIVWDKFLARQLIKKSIHAATAVLEAGGVKESLLASIEEENAVFNKLRERGDIVPKNLCSPSDFADAYYDMWFKHDREEYGYELPFGFPMRIRPAEMTLFTGDNGSGKSSMLGLISIVCAKQFKSDEKIIIASMEVPPEVTLWIMARQLLGIGKLDQTEENERQVVAAMEWLDQRVRIYNFLGITDWRELLNTFQYARKNLNGEIFIVDSVMRIGIPDDDYALQGLVAMQFAQFAVSTGSHVFLVVHENKGDGRQKDKIRGSKQWSDNASNVVAIRRNEDKAEKYEEWKQQLNAGAIDQEEFDKKVSGSRKIWDTKFILNKQRWPGSQQNASRWLYFHRGSLQFHEQPDTSSFNFLL